MLFYKYYFIFIFVCNKDKQKIKKMFFFSCLLRNKGMIDDIDERFCAWIN